jgi:uncharacterized membrane protein
MPTRSGITTTATTSIFPSNMSTSIQSNSIKDGEIFGFQLEKKLPKTSNARWYMMAVPSFLVVIYAVNFGADIPHTRFGDPEIIKRIRDSLFGNLHILSGIVATAMGPFQFIPSMRRGKASVVHRWVGRLYVAGILLGGINAFKVPFGSPCRPIGQWAFALLAAVWLATTALGMLTIWGGDVQDHKKWMTRSFACTYAAVMLRWQLPLFIHLGMGVEPALSLTGLTCWIPNLIFVEWQTKRLGKETTKKA